MGGCQNYGPFLGPYYRIRHLLFRVPQKGNLILTTTYMPRFDIEASRGAVRPA